MKKVLKKFISIFFVSAGFVFNATSFSNAEPPKHVLIIAPGGSIVNRDIVKAIQNLIEQGLTVEIRTPPGDAPNLVLWSNRLDIWKYWKGSWAELFKKTPSEEPQLFTRRALPGWKYWHSESDIEQQRLETLKAISAVIVVAGSPSEFAAHPEYYGRSNAYSDYLNHPDIRKIIQTFSDRGAPIGYLRYPNPQDPVAHNNPKGISGVSQDRSVFSISRKGESGALANDIVRALENPLLLQIRRYQIDYPSSVAPAKLGIQITEFLPKNAEDTLQTKMIQYLRPGNPLRDPEVMNEIKKAQRNGVRLVIWNPPPAKRNSGGLNQLLYLSTDQVIKLKEFVEEKTLPKNHEVSRLRLRGLRPNLSTATSKPIQFCGYVIRSLGARVHEWRVSRLSLE